MPYCAPQRYLANNRNHVRTATLDPSSVLPVEDSVLELPVARVGSGQVLLSGAYAGEETATFDVEIVDNSVGTKLPSVPVFTGAGSGTLSDIAATGTAQVYTIQLQNAGIPTLRAGVAFEGVRIIARAEGAAGNGIEIEIDQSTLVFTETDYSLLEDLNAGQGAETTGVKGPAFDWDTKVLSDDEIIPDNAHRVIFGDDQGAVYLQYKRYIDGVWSYHFVPAINRHIPKGTRISFVTGGRTVTVTPFVGSPEVFTGIETVYDLLNAFVTTSTLVDVDGVVAFDRSPTGKAAKELLARTDAHCEPSSGSGSESAKSFTDTFANANASTELVVAKCYAVAPSDHPLAIVGAERWKLQGSVSGDLGEIVTGIPYSHPDLKFGLTIPRKVPDGFGLPRGRFTLDSIVYVSRVEANKPPICVVAMGLGPAAVDQTIKLRWTERPSDDCACAGMPVPRLSKRCLGSDAFDEDSTVGYQADTVTKLTALYLYANAVARTNSGSTTVSSHTVPVPQAFVDAPQGLTPKLAVFGPDGSNPTVIANYATVPDSFLEIIASFEATIAEIDPLEDTSDRAAGMTAWDTAFTELQADVDDTTPVVLMGLDSNLYRTRLSWVLISAGISPLGKSDADVIESGDGCWRDGGGDYWTVVGSDKGGYAPAFNGITYYSSRKSADGKKYFSTKEFGFQINIACPDKLVYGDEINLVIGGAGWGSTYQIGDTLTLPILAAQPIVLAGGQDGNALLDWYVSGSIDGAMPNFVYDPDASPNGYSETGLAFTFTPGGIPHEVGDKFVFAVEGGHYRWRKNGGAWIEESPLAEITGTVEAFSDGLSVQFQTGAAPSFEPGDIFSFRAMQPWAASNIVSPDRRPWRWDEATPSYIFDFGAQKAVTGLAIHRHTIPDGATITVEGGDSPGVYLWSEPLTWAAGDIFKEVGRSARYVRLSMTGATGGGIAWFFAGDSLTTTLSADVDLRRVYKINAAGAGMAQNSNYLGRAYSGSVEWSEAALTEADIDAVGELLDWTKMHGDEPFLLVPNVARPDEVYAAIIAADDIDFSELSKYNRDVAFERRFSIALPLAGAWRA